MLQFISPLIICTLTELFRLLPGDHAECYYVPWPIIPNTNHSGQDLLSHLGPRSHSCMSNRPWPLAPSQPGFTSHSPIITSGFWEDAAFRDLPAEAGLRAEARPHSSTLTLVVLRKLTKPGWSSRPSPGRQAPGLLCLGLRVALCNEGFVSIPTLLGNQSHTSLFSCSLFLPLWPGKEGEGGICTWMEPDSLLGGQRQPFIRDRGGSGISPAGMRPCRLESPLGGQKIPRPKGVTSPGSSPEVLGAPCALSGPPSPLSPRGGGKLPRHLLPCQLLGLESCRPIPRWPLGWKVERETQP